MPRKNDNILLESYDPAWPAKAEEEIRQLKEKLAFPWMAGIQHIGSTAIPGLMAKPIIDIMVGVASLNDAKALIPIIEGMGYSFWDSNPKKDHMFFVKGMPPFGKQRTHHVHVYEVCHYEWHARQLFRDFLCRNLSMVRKYASLKTKLAKEFTKDREAYTDAKAGFIRHVISLAAPRHIGFSPLAASHFPLLKKWMDVPHVYEWWGEREVWTLEDIAKKYETYVVGHKLLDGVRKPIHAYIIQFNNCPIGYIQYYNAYDFSRRDGYLPVGSLPSPLAALDFYIGEASFIGKGLGAEVLEKFINSKVWGRFQACFVDPGTNNLPAIRCYEKAGFAFIKVTGDYIWMVKEKGNI